MENLSKGIEQISLTKQNVVKVSKPALTIEDIIKKGEALRTSTLADDIQTVAGKINKSLSKLVDSGVPLIDTTPIVNCFFLDVGELVLAAQEIRAYTLLRLLQMVYIWRDETQFHWFQALSYKSPWFEKDLWNTHLMNWRHNLRAVCEWDNDVLAAIIQEEIPAGTALKDFNEELLAFCVEYDAIKVFKLTGIEPIRLEHYLEILSTNGSAQLLRLYREQKQTAYLDLGRFPFPKKLPANVDGFEFLLKQGHDCHSMDQFITWLCTERRLDLLKHLYATESILIPTAQDLELVAEKGWLELIQWILQLGPGEGWITECFVVTLATNRHFHVLSWLINVNNTEITKFMIGKISGAGALEALQLIDEKQPMNQNHREWADAAAKECHLPVLKWLYTRFGLLPTVESLGNATVEILEWIKAIDNTLINAELVHHGAGNLKLLQWVLENAPFSILEEKKKILAGSVGNTEMMRWLFENLSLCPPNIYWVYRVGDLEAIKWAIRNCQLFPTPVDTHNLVAGGHLCVVKWLHESHSEYLNASRMFKIALQNGQLDIAEYMMLHFHPEIAASIKIDDNVVADQRLRTLKWAHEHKIGIWTSFEMNQASRNGDFQAIKWLFETFPATRPDPLVWFNSVDKGHYEIYKWLLERYPGNRQQSRFRDDIKIAYSRGHLKIIKVILNKDASLAKELLALGVEKPNYHVKQWLIANGLATK